MARAFVVVSARFGGGYFVVFWFGFCGDGCAVGEFGVGGFFGEGFYGFGFVAALSFFDAGVGMIIKLRELKTLRQKVAGLVLRRMGFAARDSFDLHCAALKAAINNNHHRNDEDKNDDKKPVDNPSAFVDGSRSESDSCGRRLATVAAAWLGEGAGVVTREEFDAHCKLLADAELKMQQQNKKQKQKPAKVAEVEKKPKDTIS